MNFSPERPRPHVFPVLVALAFCLAAASEAPAIDSCKAKIDKKTGVVLVDATNVGGPLLWGGSAGNETTAMFNAGTCVASGKAKKCQLADPATLAAKTPPAGCTVYLDDGAADCSAWVSGCTPGPRQSAGAIVKDSTGAVIGYSAEAFAQYLVHDTGSALVRLTTNMDGSGFSASGYAYFTSSDCSGTALLPADNNMVKLAHVESNSVAYYGPSTVSPQMLGSNIAYLEGINDQAGCDGYFGPGRTFVAPHGCCWTFGFPQPMGPAVSVNLAAFVPPFTTEIP